MKEIIDEIAHTLRAAREAKGLSQRALAARAGVRQSHISKIENGGVDLRLSSLVELARALDLELTLVPRKSVPAVKSIVRNISGTGSVQLKPSGTLTDAGQSTAREFERLKKILNSALTEHPAVKELAQLQRQLRQLEQLKPSLLDQDFVRQIREATKAVRSFEDQYESVNRNSALNQVRQVLADLNSARNIAAHNIPKLERPKPAYSLEEDDDG